MKIKHILSATLLISSVSYVNAQGNSPEAQLGIGLFNQNLSFNEVEVDASGFAIVGRKLARNSAIEFGFQRGSELSVGVGESSIATNNFDSTALYLDVLLTTGINKNSLYGFLGVGYFRDKWNIGEITETFTGLQLPLGVGYQFEKAAIELKLQVRDSDSYDNYADSAINSSIVFLGSF